MDIQYARDLGYRIKLLGVIKDVDGQIEVRVHPTLIPVDHMLASVGGVFNAIMVEGDIVGQTVYYGRGAGRNPTASAVISDVMDVARNLALGCPRRIPARVRQQPYGAIRDVAKIETRHYLRLSLLDKPGVLGQIASVLGRHGISIASVLQKEVRAYEYVPVVIVTHLAREKAMVAALRKMDGMEIVGAKTVRLRIEDLGEAATDRTSGAGGAAS
jgi:homoserine dehydrogenase